MKKTGKGLYQQNGLFFQFEIELDIENENFTGRILNEKPSNPEINPSSFGINFIFS